MQHYTREAFAALVTNWRAADSPDVLVDVYHASARGGTTEVIARMWRDTKLARQWFSFKAFQFTRPHGARRHGVRD